MDICRYSGKNVYYTEEGAIKAAVSSVGKYSTNKLRVYKCNWCYKWHLSSKNNRNLNYGK